MGDDGQQYDAPNQQVVRPDGSGPSDEGTGGVSDDTQPEPEQAESESEQESEEQSEESSPSPRVRTRRSRS